MTRTDDHGTLPGHAQRMLTRLDALHTLSEHGATMHVQHMDHATRARQLGDQLRSAVLLSDERHYPSALVIVRAALEHHLMDRLIFLANRHLVTYSMKKTDVPAEEARLEGLRATTRPDIERWWWEGAEMNVVSRGYHSTKSKKGRGQTISPYYFRVDEFDPFTGGKKHAERLASPFWRKKHRTEWAAEAKAMWDRWFVHRRITRAIEVNHLLTAREAMQVDIHYAFLSAFVHPSKRGYDSTSGGNHPNKMGSFHHFASELVLLYAITLAVAELDIFARMARRRPPLGLRAWDDVEREIRDARLASSYFWFLGGEPQALDRIDTVHTPPGDDDPRWGRPRRDWRKLRPWEVNYYPDPLDRVKRLHENWREMATGLMHRSPFT